MSKSTTIKILTMKIFQKSLVNVFLRANKWIWEKFPSSVTSSDLFRKYGDYVHEIALLCGIRKQNLSTFFFRNRPQLELIQRIADKKEIGSKLNIAILGCSKGAEVYSAMFLIRSKRPDLEIMLHGVDISKEGLESAQRGIYSQSIHELAAAPIFERISENEREAMFDKYGDALTIKPWIREGIIWHLGDVAEHKIIEDIGYQDIVVANNFLCHMASSDSERCLRNIAKLVRNSGYLCHRNRFGNSIKDRPRFILAPRL